MQKRRNKLLAALNTYLFYGQQIMVTFFGILLYKNEKSVCIRGNSIDTSWCEARYGIDFSSGRKRSVLSSG